MQIDKNDRQIRLWGPKGQRKLQKSKVALVGCSGAGIETLKNLVLPGVGEIHIWDDAKIQVSDLSQSFFYEYDSVGKSKAQQALKNLLQINPDVHGHFFEKSVTDFLSQQINYTEYSLVIFGNNLPKTLLIESSNKLWSYKVAAIYIVVHGYFCYVRLQKQLHFVEFVNSPSKKYSLRISDPFEELQDYSSQFHVYELTDRVAKIDNLSDKRQDLRVLSYIPYPVILIQVFERLFKSYNKRPNRQELLAELKRIRQIIPEQYSQNFHEAQMRVMDAYQTNDNFMDIDLISQDNKLIKHCLCQQNPPKLAKVLKSISSFYRENERKLPQNTNLPDMETDTKQYQSIRMAYKSRHSKDVRRIQQIYQQTFSEQIEQSQISTCVNNLQNIEIVKMGKLSQEIEKPDFEMFQYSDCKFQCMYIAMQAQQEYRARNSEQICTHFQQLKEIANQLIKVKFAALLPSYSNQQTEQSNQQLLDRYLREICRTGGKTTINICSIAGAIAGQQAIKLMINCFVPMNCGYLFDGAHGAGTQVCLSTQQSIIE